jgi:hypothetical protein
MPPWEAFREAARRGENPRGAGARAAAAATARIVAEVVPALVGEPKRVVSMRWARRWVCRGRSPSATSGGGGIVRFFLFALNFSPVDHQSGCDEDWRPDGTDDIIFFYGAQTRRTRTKS